MKNILIIMALLLLTASCTNAEYNILTASKASHAFKLDGYIVGSSSQIRYKGKRFTLTAAHVCVGWQGAEPTVNGQDVKILDIDTKHDLCVLTPVKSERVLTVRSQRLYRHEKVFTVGHPDGYPQTIFEGRYVSKSSVKLPQVNKEFDTELLPLMMVFGIIEILNYDSSLFAMPIFPGSSGSPVLDMRGRLVSVSFASRRSISSDFFTHGVPLKFIKIFLNKQVKK